MADTIRSVPATPSLVARLGVIAIAGAACVVSCSLLTESSDLTSGGPLPPDTAVVDSTLVDGASDARTDAPPSEGGDSFAPEVNDADAMVDGDARDDGPFVCPSAKMIMLDDGFCIDPGEVTQAEYAVFLNASPSLTLNPSTCGWNLSFVPDGWVPVAPFTPPTGNANRPVTSIDWCDAASYCAWAGKALCGNRIVGAGATPFFSYADPARSKWFAACANAPKPDAGSPTAFPYGDAYAPETCNGSDYATTAAPLPALSSCRSKAGVLDLSGNVAEWENACNPIDAGASGEVGRDDPCRVRGGSYSDVEAALRCGADSTRTRESRVATVGFRCCTP